MNKIIISILTVLFFNCFIASAQLTEAFVHEGEFGISAGVGHYFGDLTTDMPIKNLKPKIAMGIFFKKQFNNYVGIKINGNYCFLGYSDVYTDYAQNSVKKLRNLSFNSDVWELSISGDFNFFKFQPGFDEYKYTPYISLGVGVFSFSPYAFLNGQKYMLRELGTEGQNDKINYPALSAYGNMALCFPLALGIKYNLTDKINVFGEIAYRFTNTDYLDDVSGSYAPDAFPPDALGNPSPAYLLQDRSYEYGAPIGIKDRQRGNNKQRDSYVTTQIGISFNLSSYRCPKY